jgi:hypothetical protein
MTTRAHLHNLVDLLPDCELESARRLLAALPEDPMLRVLMDAPIDDEPVTAEERRLLDEARESLRTEGGITTVELRRQVYQGLSDEEAAHIDRHQARSANMFATETR